MLWKHRFGKGLCMDLSFATKAFRKWILLCQTLVRQTCLTVIHWKVRGQRDSVMSCLYFSKGRAKMLKTFKIQSTSGYVISCNPFMFFYTSINMCFSFLIQVNTRWEGILLHLLVKLEATPFLRQMKQDQVESQDI